MRNTILDSNDSIVTLLTPLAKRLCTGFLRTGGSRKIIAVLTTMVLVSSSVLLAVRAADGDLDITFGSSGKVTTGFVDFGFDTGTSVAVQSDGKIVVAGTAMDANFTDQFVALVRYDTNGNLDPTFGVGGKVVTDLAATSFGNSGPIRYDVAIQSDGKIVVAGTIGGYLVQPDFGIARYDTNGNPDPTFGNSGEVIIDFFGNADGAWSVAIQGDGKIVVAGQATGSGFYPDFALARLDANGNLDSGFGAGGKLTTDFFGFAESAAGVAVQADGRIVAVGQVGTGNGNTDIGLARYNADGTLDQAFGTNGKVTSDFSSEFFDDATSVAIQSDGRIVVAGSALGSSLNWDFLVARYDTTGALDATFGANGKVTTDFINGFDHANDVVIQSDGKIVAVGTTSDSVDVETHLDFGLARYDVNGNLDPTFGGGGEVITDFSGTDYGLGIAIGPDCKIVAAGLCWHLDTGDSDFAVARYNSSGCLAGSSTCPLSHGYWKTTTDPWPVNSLTLGSQSYTKSELLALLSTSSQTDASLILARQLIAAKLNVANGADPTPVAGIITDSDALLSGFSGKLPYKVRSSSSVGQAMTADAAVLTDYNKGLLTPGCAE